MRHRDARQRLLPGLLCVALSSALPAQAEHQSVRSDHLRCDVWAPYPRSLEDGYTPIFADVQCSGNRDQDVTIDVRNIYGYSTQSVSRSLTLAPGERRRVLLLAPSIQSYRASYGVQVRMEGEDFGLVVTPPGGTHREAAVLVFSRDPLPAGRAEQWQQRLSEPGMSPSGREVSISTALFDDLAPRFEAYSRVDAVIVVTQGGLPGREHLAPLLQWVRLGGRVAFLGPDALQSAYDLEEVEPWTESRFVVEGGDQHLLVRHGSGLALFHEVARAYEPDGGWPSSDQTLTALLGSSTGLRAPAELRSGEDWAAIEGLKSIPYPAFIVVLVLFAIVIYPLNFVYLRRRGRSTLVVLTVPLIALATSVLMLLYGIFYQGIDNRIASRTYTVLDQRLHRASTMEKRQLYIGLQSVEGLLPGAGSACIPVRLVSEDATYTVQMDDGICLAGDYLPSRSVVDHYWMTDQPARLRLTLRPSAEGYLVENGLGATIEELVVRDLDGNYFAGGARMAAGKQFEVHPIGARPDPEIGALLTEAQRCLFDSAGLLPGTYAARVAEGLFLDLGGLEPDELVSDSIIVGIPGAGEVEWR